jgi:hypothetical protein
MPLMVALELWAHASERQSAREQGCAETTEFHEINLLNRESSYDYSHERKQVNG